MNKYMTSRIFRDIFAGRRRLALVGAVLLVMFGVFVCCLIFISASRVLIDNAAETHLKKISCRFNPDFQWLKTDSLTPFNPTGGDSAFNNDGSMNKYNVPTYTERELFDRFAEYPHLTRYGLAYALQVYRGIKIDPEKLSEQNRKSYERIPESFDSNILYGCSFGDFQWMSCGIRGTGTGVLSAEITAGREHGKGECLISQITAEKFGYEIGDRLEFEDSEGRTISSAVISGFFSYNFNYSPPAADDTSEDHEMLRLNYTNPFFRIEHQRIRYLIITDFDTAYNLLPAGKHEINSYIAYYELKNYRLLDEFIEFCGEYENSWMMRLQPDMFSYLDAAETPLNMKSVCIKFMAAAGVISSTATVLLIIFNLGLRRRETGILASVGIRNRSISAKYGFEYAIFIAGVAALSAGAGYLLAKACLASAEWLIRGGYFVNADASVIVFCALAAAAGGVCAAVVTAIQLKVFSIPELMGRDG